MTDARLDKLCSDLSDCALCLEGIEYSKTINEMEGIIEIFAWPTKINVVGGKHDGEEGYAHIEWDVASILKLFSKVLLLEFKNMADADMPGGWAGLVECCVTVSGYIGRNRETEIVVNLFTIPPCF